MRNNNLRASASYVTGSHAVKVGFTLLYATETMTGHHNNGDVSYTVLNGRPTRVTYWALPYLLKFRLQPRAAIFAQDQWTYRRMTLNAGLRYDYLKSDYPDQHQPAGRFVPVARDVPGQVAVSWKRSLAPPGGLVRPVRQREDGAQGKPQPIRARTPARAINPVLT